MTYCESLNSMEIEQTQREEKERQTLENVIAEWLSVAPQLKELADNKRVDFDIISSIFGNNNNFDIQITIKKCRIQNFKLFMQDILTQRYGKDNIQDTDIGFIISIDSDIQKTSFNIIPCEQITNLQTNAWDSKRDKQIVFYTKLNNTNAEILNFKTNGFYSSFSKVAKTIKNEMINNKIRTAYSISAYQIDCVLFNAIKNNYEQISVFNDNQKELGFVNTIGFIQKKLLYSWKDATKLLEINAHKKLFPNSHYYKKLTNFINDLSIFSHENCFATRQFC